MDQQITVMWAQVVATAGGGLLQCGIVGRWLWRNGKDLEKRRLVIDAQGERFAALGRELDEALAQSQARRARTVGGNPHD